MDFMLKQLLIVLVLLAVTPYIVGIVLALLAKLRLLPLAVCSLSFPASPIGGSDSVAIGLLAVCALYPIVYWTLRFIRWRQEERYYAHSLLATAKPLYAPAEYEDYDNKEECGYNA